MKHVKKMNEDYESSMYELFKTHLIYDLKTACLKYSVLSKKDILMCLSEVEEKIKKI